MINWIAIVMVSVGALIGQEIARRRAEAKGRTHSYQPLHLHRALMAVLTAAIALFVEAARVTLSNEATSHMWLLIGSAAIGHLVLLIWSANEMRHLRLRIERSSS